MSTLSPGRYSRQMRKVPGLDLDLDFLLFYTISYNQSINKYYILATRTQKQKKITINRK